MSDGDRVPIEEELRCLRERLTALEADNAQLRREVDRERQPPSAQIDVEEGGPAGEALRKQVAFVESLVRTAAEGICVCRAIETPPFVVFSVWNDRMTELTGYTLDEINRLGWYQALYPDPDLQSRVVERMRRMGEGSDLRSEEWTVTRKDGQPRTLAMSTSRVDTDEGPAVVAFMHDVTDLNKAFEERRRLQEKLHRARHLESLGVLAEGIAHDFNNILTATLGYANLAETQVPADSPAREHLLQVEVSVRRAAALCQQMLAFAGKGTAQLEPLDFNRLVGETAALLDPSLAPKVEVKLDLAEHLPPVLGDAVQMRQALLGVLVNASEAIDESEGVIRVGTRVETLAQSHLARLQLGDDLPEGEYVLLEVADTGMGMDEATRGRIFEPFFSTKFMGRGLGLSAVLGIVRRHRGALEVVSQPGKGSTVRLWFPAVETGRGV